MGTYDLKILRENLELGKRWDEYLTGLMFSRKCLVPLKIVSCEVLSIASGMTE